MSGTTSATAAAASRSPATGPAKPLTEHKADRATVVHAALAEAGITPPEADRCSATQTTDDGTPRYRWTTPSSNVDAEHRRLVIRQAITEHLRWRTEYAEAKVRAGPHNDRSATVREPTTTAA
jgi:hypothetical protein